tara:strand:+ start:1416 stop:2252 length:837 start_codon:yes stop_codon:yes gene_type:complete
VEIKKNESIDIVIKNNVKNYYIFDILILKILYQSNKILFKKFIHFGNFYLDNNITLIDFFNIISKPSNVLNSITIVEGWTQEKLNSELSKHFNNIYNIPYENIIADTYFFKKNDDFDTFVLTLQEIKNQYLKNFFKNQKYKKYSHNEIMIIGSLLEKEGLDNQDKKVISSVIFNRLNIDMKLQIDATVLYAITNGKYNLKRKLLLSDLKFDNPFNTYLYKGLPPKPISYVGKKTIDIIFDDYKSDFLFYFFNKSLNRHIFSVTFADHKKKLNEYRNSK